MKKTLAIAAVAAMIPFAAHAKTAISDAQMGSVTGQAGVSINLDVRMDLTMDAASWGDADGIGGTSTAGWIGMKGFAASNIGVKARTDYLTGANTANLQFLTIDVATDDAAGSYTGTANTSFVRLGLGTMEISADSIGFDVALGATGTKAGLTQVLGSVYMGGLDMKIHENSHVDIFANNGANGGVTFNDAILLDSVSAAAISWGNNGYAAATAGAGYVGLQNMKISNLAFNGAVSINVATASTSAAGHIAAPGDLNYWSNVYANAAIGAASAAGAGANSTLATMSYVHIGLGSGLSSDTSKVFEVSADSFDANVVLANSADLKGTVPGLTSGTLGQVHMEKVDFKVNGWVDIAAH